MAVRERMLASATRLFAERGFKAVSTREIAARCGVTLSSLYHHFGDKRSLYLRVHLHEFEKSSARLEAAMAQGAVVIRSMPNSPALIGAGVAAMSGGDMATAADLDWAEGILGSVGSVVRLPERQLAAVRDRHPRAVDGLVRQPRRSELDGIEPAGDPADRLVHDVDVARGGERRRSAIGGASRRP